MANLDTRSKRASSVGILMPFILAPVAPDGTIDQGDRQHTAWSYSGILAQLGINITPVAAAFALLTTRSRVLVYGSTGPQIRATTNQIPNVRGATSLTPTIRSTSNVIPTVYDTEEH